MVEEKKGILFLIPTPIGNLEDMTYRAVRTLKEVDVIAAEDTRRTRQLLNHFSIEGTFLFRYDEHTKETAGNELLGKLCQGQDIGLVSDAGMPGISDPGTDLVQKAIIQGIRVVPLPGANAGLTALIASGLETEHFSFLGFLPRTEKKQKEVLREWSSFPGTLIFYEAPHRLRKTLASCLEVLGNRRAVLGRELTKKFEEFRRDSLEQLLTDLETREPRGEFVLIVAPRENEPIPEIEKERAESYAREKLELLLVEGVSKKEASRQIAQEFHLARRIVYSWTLEK